MGSHISRPVVTAALAWAVVLGCKATDPPAERAGLTPEQEAIRDYSEDTEEVDKRLPGFIAAWDKAIQEEEVDKLVYEVTEHAIPALEEHLAALDKMRAGTPRLAEVHAVLVDARGEMLEALRAFARDLREDNRQKPIEALISALAEVSEKEEAYRSQLQRYYEDNRVPIKSSPPLRPAAPEEPAPGADGATEAAPAADAQ
jgi:hypothetical protein